MNALTLFNVYNRWLAVKPLVCQMIARTHTLTVNGKSCSGDRSVPCVIRQLIRSPDYLWVYESSSMFYMMIVYCCVFVTVVVTDDVITCCVSDGDCCCVVVL